MHIEVTPERNIPNIEASIDQKLYSFSSVSGLTCWIFNSHFNYKTWIGSSSIDEWRADSETNIEYETHLSNKK